MADSPELEALRMERELINAKIADKMRQHHTAGLAQRTVEDLAKKLKRTSAVLTIVIVSMALLQVAIATYQVSLWLQAETIR